MRLLIIGLCLLANLAFAQTYPSSKFGKIDLMGGGSTGDVSSMAVKPSAGDGSSAFQLATAIRGAGQIEIEDFAPAGNGSTDDYAKFSAAFAKCNTLGGGTVLLGPKQYLISSADLTVPENCTLSGRYYPGGQRTSQNYINKPYTIVLGSGRTIRVSQAAAVSNIIIRRSGMTVPATVRDNINNVAAFAGTGLTCAGHDCRVSDVMVLGFGTCFSSTNWQRPYLTRFYGDCANGISIDNAHDVARMSFIHIWPFSTTNLGCCTTHTQAISSITGNGSGLYRVTVPSTATFQTGDTAYVVAPTGAQSAIGKWVITVVNSTTVDLQGSSSSPVTFTASTNSGSNVINAVSSLSNIGIGATITCGSSLPGGTTVLGKWPTESALVLSNPATANGTGTSCTVTDAAYTSGGTLKINTNIRSGYGIKVTNSETAVCTDCFVYGYQTAFWAGEGASWFTLLAPQCDTDNGLDPTTECFRIDGTATGTSIIGGSTQSAGYGLVLNATGNGPHVLQGIQLNNAGHSVIAQSKGALTLIGVSTPPKTSGIYFSDAATSIAAVGINMGGTTQYFQTSTGKNKSYSIGSILAPGAYQGNLKYPGVVELGAAGCGGLVTCYTQIKGAFVMIPSKVTMTEGGTSGNISGDKYALNFTAAANISAYSITLPNVGTPGQTLEMYFDRAVASLTTTASRTVRNMPTSINAGSWHRCTLDDTAANWLCN